MSCDRITNLSLWMTNLDKPLRNLPIIYLAIPGSHDSMTFGINSSSQIAPDCETIVRYLLRLGPFIKKIVVKWSITQSLSVSEQLNQGIRYFDLRIAKYDDDNKFYFVHSLVGPEITTQLEEICKFLEGNKMEVVILDFQHFYNLTLSDHSRLMDIIFSVFTYRICPFTNCIHEVTLEWMKNKSYQVIIIYRCNIVRDPRLWMSCVYPTFWPNTTSLRKLMPFLDSVVKNRENSCGFVTQCLLTPDAGFIVRNIFGNLNKSCAKPCLEAVLPWIEQQHAGCPIESSGINVVICDFVEQQDGVFCRTVIDLNHKMLTMRS